MTRIAQNRTELDAFAWGIIRRKAGQMVGRAGLTDDDRDDLVQELVLRLWQSGPRFDPNQAHWKSFVTAVVERNVAKILRDRLAAKRAAGRPGPLDPAGGPAAGSDDLRRREQTLDVAGVLAGLPADLRDVADRLTTQSLSEAARALGVPRSSLQRRARRLRRHFATAGLGKIARGVR